MKKRFIELDVLRVIAALLVVAIHADNITSSSANYLGGTSWWLANTINTLGRTAVPIFIMISGALLLRNKEISFDSVLKRSWKRIILPGIFWIALYFWWQNQWHGGQYSITSGLVNVFANATGHLYYLSVILGLYIFTPLGVKIVKKMQIKYLVISLFFVSLLSFTVFYIPDLIIFKSLPIYWIFFVPYFLIGNYLKDFHLEKINYRLILLGLIILSVGLGSYSHYLGNHALTLTKSVWWINLLNGNFFQDHFSPTNILASVSFFLLIKTFNFRRVDNFVRNNLVWLSGASYGIYLVHPFIIDLLDHYGNMSVHLITHDLWAYYLWRIVLTFFFSWIFVEIVRILRLSRLLLGEKD